MKKLNFLKPIMVIFILLLFSQCEDNSIDFIQTINHRGFVDINQDSRLELLQQEVFNKMGSNPKSKSTQTSIAEGNWSHVYKVETNSKVNYTVPLSSDGSDGIKYLIISDAQEKTAYILNFIPDKAWLDSDFEEITPKNFTGIVEGQRLDGEIVARTKYENGQKVEYSQTNGRTESCEYRLDIEMTYVCVNDDCLLTEITTSQSITCTGGGNDLGEPIGTGAPNSGNGSGSSGGNEPDVIGIEAFDDFVVISPDRPINDMIKYLECFDTSKSATITIYADQPKKGSSDAWAATWSGAVVGHTFVSITQGANTSVFGFYPSTDNTSVTSPPETSTMGNDSGEYFDVSVSATVSGNKLAEILNYSINYPGTYDLDNYNCSDFGIQIGNLAGLGLPDCYGSWPGGGGSNPGTLGQHLRNMTLPNGATRNTSGGTAPTNKKGC